jgi:IQ calmodulin-binding motif
LTPCQAALDQVESRNPADAHVSIRFARESSEQLRAMAHAAIVIQSYWRGRRARRLSNLDTLNAFASSIVKVRLIDRQIVKV